MTHDPSSAPAEPSHARRHVPSRANAVATLLVAGVSLALLVLVARVAQLQVAPGERLQAFIQGRVSNAPEMARRGDVLDRRGRPLAMTRVGQQVFVDPVAFPEKDREKALADLARATGIPMAQIGETLYPKIAENERRKETGQSPVRYVRLTGVLNDATLEAVRSAKIAGVHLEDVSVREGPGSDLGAALVGRVGADHAGQFGAERRFDKSLDGADGAMRYVRDARGRPLWLEPAGYTPPQSGADIRLSIDARMQEIAEEELRRGVEEADAQGGRLVMVDPATGEVLATADYIREMGSSVTPWKKRAAANSSSRRSVIPPDPNRAIAPAAGRNRCFTDLYEPGSSFKPIAWSTLTAAGAARLDEVFVTGGRAWTTFYGRPIHDTHPKDAQTWKEALVNSSNIAMSMAAERVSFTVMRDGMRRFGFGSKTGAGVQGEREGRVTPPKLWSKYTQTSVSFGQEVGVTAAQMARAFCVFAREGDLVGALPDLRLTAADPGEAPSEIVRRVVPEWVVREARDAMASVFAAADRQMRARKQEATFDYLLFGKSGTAQVAIEGEKGYVPDQYISNFVGAGPIERPRLVCIVVIDDPGPEMVRTRRYFGSQVAAPVVRRVLERSLSYLGVPPDATPEALAAHVDAATD